VSLVTDEKDVSRVGGRWSDAVRTFGRRSLAGQFLAFQLLVVVVVLGAVAVV